MPLNTTITALDGDTQFGTYVARSEESPRAQAAMHASLGDQPKATVCDHEGLDHGFAEEIVRCPDEKAALLADHRTSAFFAEHLG